MFEFLFRKACSHNWVEIGCEKMYARNLDGYDLGQTHCPIYRPIRVTVKTFKCPHCQKMKYDYVAGHVERWEEPSV